MLGRLDAKIELQRCGCPLSKTDGSGQEVFEDELGLQRLPIRWKQDRPDFRSAGNSQPKEPKGYYHRGPI